MRPQRRRTDIRRCLESLVGRCGRRDVRRLRLDRRQRRAGPLDAGRGRRAGSARSPSPPRGRGTSASRGCWRRAPASSSSSSSTATARSPPAGWNAPRAAMRADDRPGRRLRAAARAAPRGVGLQPAVRPRVGHAHRAGRRLRRRRDHARRALREVGGYDPSLSPARSRSCACGCAAAAGSIERIDAEMTVHDAAMTRFGQWWKRRSAPATPTPRAPPDRARRRAPLGA